MQYSTFMLCPGDIDYIDQLEESIKKLFPLARIYKGDATIYNSKSYIQTTNQIIFYLFDQAIEHSPISEGSKEKLKKSIFTNSIDSSIMESYPIESFPESEQETIKALYQL